MKAVKLAAIALAFVLCPFAQGQHVKVNWNAKTPLSKYKTYSWKSAKNPGNPLFAQWVQPDVDSKLAVAGIQFLYPGQNPDLYVIYSVHTVEKEDATTTMDGYGWADGPWSSYSGLNDQEAEGLAPVEVVTTDTPSTLGILTIDIVDRVKKVVVWRAQGSIEHISKSDRKNSDQVQRLVNKMFQKFPPS